MPEALELFCIDSQGALREKMRSSVHKIIVGAEAEAVRNCYAVRLPKSLSEVLSVGILSSGLGATPKTVFDSSGRRLLIGHDCCVTAISLESMSVAYSIKLPSVFIEFVLLKKSGTITLIHELGVLELDRDGDRNWAVDTDVIEKYSIEGDHIELSEMDGNHKIRLSLKNGAID